MEESKRDSSREALAVYFGLYIAYKRRDRPGAQSERDGETAMATKKARKSSKQLKKGKKLARTKPLLSWSWGGSQTGSKS